jgi:uncharacterized membrane protein YphA (DoxX/SURF4 family)
MNYIKIISNFFTTPHALAHEVYVLTPDAVKQAMTSVSPNPFNAVPGHAALFIGWGLACAILFIGMLSLSVNKAFERVFDPVLFRLKKFAPLLSRLTLGASLFASGYYGAVFGPELPLSHLFGNVHVASIVLMVAGAFIVFGFLTRLIAGLGIMFFASLIFAYHGYMLTYLNYLGELLIVFIIGGGRWSIDRSVPLLSKIENTIRTWTVILEPYSFLILRVFFGLAIFFASFYAKFVHSNLALETVNQYHLTNYFHFTPLFLVLGAFLVEAIFGLCFIFGIEVRFMALLFTGFLTLSILFFGEAVWPHIVLFGVTMALFCHGYDRYTLEVALFQRHKPGEPVL